MIPATWEASELQANTDFDVVLPLTLAILALRLTRGNGLLGMLETVWIATLRPGRLTPRSCSEPP